MSRYSECRFEIWCEDRAHDRFAREILTHLGVHRRRIHVNPAPKGLGDASDWVKGQCADLARRVSATARQQNLKFLVILDGDREGWIERKRQLNAEVGTAVIDRVALWVPTWSIETWVLWLSGQDVDESSSLKSECDFSRLVSKATTSWRSPRAAEADKVPSLTDARRELERVVPG